VISSPHYRFKSCCRFEELSNALLFHVGFEKAALAPTEFRFLNSGTPMKIGFDPIDEGQDSYDRFMYQLKNPAEGGTPLCRHIHEITHDIEQRVD
jgi:hypothetical protein